MHFSETGTPLRDEVMEATIWAVRASRYNAAYYVSRKDARRIRPYVTMNAKLVDETGRWLDSSGGASRILNFALHSFAQSYDKDPGKSIVPPPSAIPPRAIQSVRPGVIAVNPETFLHRDAADSYRVAEPMFDVHDLSHLVASNVTNGAFGAKFTDLDRLGGAYDHLRFGADESPFSDMVVLGQLSRALLQSFEPSHAPDRWTPDISDDIQAQITAELVKYLRGERSIQDPQTGQEFQADRPIDPMELALCLQCKRYERRASEFEGFILTRGSSEDARGIPARDPLYHLSRSERIAHIAALPDSELLYFEARNLIRNRAHEGALAVLATQMLVEREASLATATTATERIRLQEEIDLLGRALDVFQLRDLAVGREEINLYREVEKIVNARR